MNPAQLSLGFEHSAFTFGHESNVSVDRLKINPAEVLPGTLIYVVQKGLQYMELEASVQVSAIQSKIFF